jgi:hypothetical protein
LSPLLRSRLAWSVVDLGMVQVLRG